MGVTSKARTCCSVLVVLVSVLTGGVVSGVFSDIGLFVGLAALSPVLVGVAPAFLPKGAMDSAFSIDHLPAGALQARVAVVTGANAGLGFATCKQLASKGATVVMGCRSMVKCARAAEAIRALGLPGKLVPLLLDLSSLQSVAAFAAEVKARFHRLDHLVLNAGVSGFHGASPLTADGVERTFATNHLGHFKLYRDLEATLSNTAEAHGSATVVVVSSCAIFMSLPPPGVYLDLEELNAPGNFEANAYYGQSKLANVLFAGEAAKRMRATGKAVYVNACNPGAVDTQIFDQFLDVIKRNIHHGQSFLLDLAHRFRQQAIWTADDGARTQVFLAVSPKVAEQQMQGGYYHPVVQPVGVPAVALDAAVQTGLWDFSEALLRDRGF